MNMEDTVVELVHQKVEHDTNFGQRNHDRKGSQFLYWKKKFEGGLYENYALINSNRHKVFYGLKNRNKGV